MSTRSPVRCGPPGDGNLRDQVSRFPGFGRLRGAPGDLGGNTAELRHSRPRAEKTLKSVKNPGDQAQKELYVPEAEYGQ
ncbi:hypothetical protein [Arthrobacter sp. YD2]|uniref:hypothetical protein n=1 Tax=Arthrobacter sp. YD2 TaxID=3058046 RepID=UPI0025B4B34F|nr:hypothetical protein [Arthrobacter sp. YD2]MDN3904524.1 hypothetical protein [Arthrobacter sp. YD2]